MRNKTLLFFLIFLLFSCSSTNTQKLKYDADLVLEISNHYHNNEEFDEERNVLENFIRVHGTKDSRINYNLLYLYYSTSNFQALEKNAKIFLKNATESDYILYSRVLALGYEKNNETEKAKIIYDDILKLDSAGEDDYLAYAKFLESIDSIKEAETIIKSAVEDKFFLTKDVLEFACKLHSDNEEYKILLDNIL